MGHYTYDIYINYIPHILYNTCVLPQVPPSLCSVTCTAGFRKIHQKQTADCCFDCDQCPENAVSNETGTCLHTEEKLMDSNAFTPQTRNMIWPRWKLKT